MNSTLASSKRFVVSAGDYAQLKEGGKRGVSDRIPSEGFVRLK